MKLVSNTTKSSNEESKSSSTASKPSTAPSNALKLAAMRKYVKQKTSDQDSNVEAAQSKKNPQGENERTPIPHQSDDEESNSVKRKPGHANQINSTKPFSTSSGHGSKDSLEFQPTENIDFQPSERDRRLDSLQQLNSNLSGM